VKSSKETKIIVEEQFVTDNITKRKEILEKKLLSIIKVSEKA
jgi:hypothetical protein